MLRVIIEKEMRDLVGSTKFAITFAVAALLIVGAFYVGATRHKLNVEQVEASKAENLRQMEGLTDWLRLESNRIFLPPQPLAALVSGISNDIGRTVSVVGRGEQTAYSSRYNEDPIYAAFRFLDLEFIFQIILSLFAILLGFDAVSGEKERGTLRLSLANAVPRATYIFGKVTGAYIALSVSILLAVAIGSLLLPVMGVNLSGADWGRLALVVLTGLLYFGAFLTMSVFVSALTHRTSNSFLVLLVVWVMSVMVIPRATVLLAGRAVDVPTVDEISAQKASFRSQLWKESRAHMMDFKPTGDMMEFGDQFSRFMDSLSDIREAKMAELVGRLNEERYNRQLEQQKVAFALARVSPSAALSLATSTLAGTSLKLADHFKDEATAYQEDYAAFIKEKTGVVPGAGMVMIKIGEEEPEPIDPAELPEFHYDPVSLGETVEAAAMDMGLLAFFNLLFFAGAFTAFLRYDVR